MPGLFKLADEPAYKSWKDQLFYTYRGLILSQNYSKLISNEFFMALTSLIQGDRWIHLWKSLNTSYPCAYHNFGHMLDVYDLVSKSNQASTHDLLAALYHDFGYSPSASGKDNIRSAIRAVRHDMSFLGFPDSHQNEVIRKIEATENHFECRNYETPLVVADLSILNAPARTYRAYRDAVREEYSHVSDEEFRKGRLAALGSLLGNIVKYGMLPKDSCVAAREELHQLRKLKVDSAKYKGVIALYGGSFDPFHKGHLEVVKKAKEMGIFTIIAILPNSGKTQTLPPHIRKGIAEMALLKAGLKDHASVTTQYSGIAEAFADQGCSRMLRGVRSGDPSSVSEETNRATLIKAEMGIETILIPTSGLCSSYSSSSVKELIRMGHPAYGVNSYTRAILAEKLYEKKITLVVGGIASGKTTYCSGLKGVVVLDMDYIAKKYLYSNPAYKESPERILRYFSSKQKYLGYMSRVKPVIMAGLLSELVMCSGNHIYIQCNKLGLLWKDLLRLCNYNIVFMEDIPKEEAQARVTKRGSSDKTLEAVLALEQYAPSYEEMSAFVESRKKQALGVFGHTCPLGGSFNVQIIKRSF